MEFKLQITGILNEEEIDLELDQESINVVEKIKTSGFSGLDILVYLLTFGGGVTIIQLAKIITKLIEKNKIKSVSIDGVEIKGYSFRQVEKLLKTIHETKK